MSVERLAGELEVSKVCVRRHLGLLESDGLVTFEEERHDRGRPRFIYRLTDKAARLFPQIYDEFAKEALTAVRRNFGDDAPQRIVAEIAPDCGERLFRELVVNLREEARRLIRQTVNEARTPAVVTLLFEGDQPVAFEKAQVPPHTDLRHFQLSGQALDAHRAVGFEQINNRAASLFEDIFYGGHIHEPIIEGGNGFCQLFGFQNTEARAPLGRISIVCTEGTTTGDTGRHGDKSGRAMTFHLFSPWRR